MGNYASAVQWCEDNIMQSQYDSFDDWLEACRDEFTNKNAEALFSNADFLDLMRKSWNEFSEEQEETAEERKEISDEIERRMKEEQIKQEVEEEIRKGRVEVTPERPEEPPKESVPIVQVVDTSPRVIPATGQAPIVTTQKFQFKEPSRVRQFFSKVSGIRRLFRR